MGDLTTRNAPDRQVGWASDRPGRPVQEPFTGPSLEEDGPVTLAALAALAVLAAGALARAARRMSRRDAVAQRLLVPLDIPVDGARRARRALPAPPGRVAAA